MIKPLILIIDDDPALQKTLGDILRLKGYDILTARNGAEGLDLLKQSNANLALVDLGLPDISGMEVLSRIKTDHPTVEAIILTSNCDSSLMSVLLNIKLGELTMKKSRIIIIDDEEGVRRSLTEILKMVGYEVQAAINGTEGLLMIEERRFDLALIDLGLPDIEGLELLNQLKIKYPDMEAIILTGNATIDSAVDATNLGAFSYMIKPYDIDQLLLLIKRAIEKRQATADLQATQLQMFQSEKMASIGQLAAGVAHEINNPIGFILSNLSTLAKYSERLIEFLQIQTEYLDSPADPDKLAALQEKRKQFRLDYIIKDTPQLIDESLEGAERVKIIVQNLKAFSRKDEEQWKFADLNDCLDNTLNVVWNELKYKATVVKEYSELPALKCNPGQLNQVFMNLLVNAAQAIEIMGAITIKTWHHQGVIHVSITDNGSGIPEDVKGRIFEPFFTTKDVGKGTGLGLSISYDIIKKHGGSIDIESEPGRGTTFTVALPLSEDKQ